MSEKNEDKYFTLNTINQLGLERNEKLDAIEEASGGGGGGDATAANQSLQLAQETVTASNTSSIVSNQTNGNAKVQVMGNTEADGSGTSEHLHTDGNGNLNVQVISSVNTVPANSVNSGVTNDPANSVAVGMRGRTDIALASSETFIKCDSVGSVHTLGLKDAVPTAVTTTNVNANSTFTSATLNLNGYSTVAMLGNTTNTSDEMRIEVSLDGSTWFKDPTSVLYDFSTGDYVATLNQNGSAGAIQYCRLTQTDTTTTAFTVQFGASRR